MQRSDDWSERLSPAIARLMSDRRQRIGEAAGRLIRPGDYIAMKRKDLAVVVQNDARFQRLGEAIHQTRTQQLENVGKLLESYSYKGVLDRGFVVVRGSDGAPVTTADMLSAGDEISLAFKDDGRAEAVVSSVGGDSKPAKPKKRPSKRKPKSDGSQGQLL